MGHLPITAEDEFAPFVAHLAQLRQQFTAHRGRSGHRFVRVVEHRGDREGNHADAVVVGLHVPTHCIGLHLPNAPHHGFGLFAHVDRGAAPGLFIGIKKVRVVALGKEHGIGEFVLPRQGLLYTDNVRCLIEHPVEEPLLCSVFDSFEVERDYFHNGP